MSADETDKLQEKLVENTTGPASPDIATTDENLSIENMYYQAALPSLGRQIFSVIKMNGPTAGLFNTRQKVGTNDFELVRANVSVYPSVSQPTGITAEAIQDIKAQYGIEANDIIGKLLRGISNTGENSNTLTFLNANSPAIQIADNITLTSNAETNLFNISQRVQEKVLLINSKGLRSYEAFAVVPYKAAASIMALGKYVADTDNTRGLFIAQIGQTRYYVNPDPLSTTAYVGIKDLRNPTKSSAVFSPYRANIIEAVDSLTGNTMYHIFNRYAITLSPLSVLGDEMLHKFTIA